MADEIIVLEEDSCVLMEATDRYHELVTVILHELEIHVPIINPLAIKQNGNDTSIRKVIIDSMGTKKIAKLALDN